MRMTLEELAALLGGEVVGPGDGVIRGVAGIEDAGEGEITFIANPKYRPKLGTTRAAAVIVPPDPREGPVPLLVIEDPYLAFTRALEVFHPEDRPPPGVSDRAWIDPSARIAETATVLPFVYVGAEATVGARTLLYPFAYVGRGARVGDDCRIHGHASIREGCVLGDRVVLQNGAVVGGDGYGFAPEGGGYRKIPQVGIVWIEDDVEVGANTCIDRATMGKTRIGRGTKIDNLVQVAHNVQIGEDVLLVSQVGISGSSSIGDRSALGGQVGVVGHVQIGSGVQIGAKSGVHSAIADGEIVGGIPAMPYHQFMKTMAVFKTLPQMRERIRRLEREIQNLREGLEEAEKGEGTKGKAS